MKHITFFGIFNVLGVATSLLLKHFQSITNYMVKSDEENIEILLKTDKDKVLFQNTVDRLMKDHDKTEEKIKINDKEITISI
ncbi:hypothetical protein [Elizabethkingia occulta]|nr:hypothetical protein [Elizabethkingia anophelis]